ncbi:hypothetical protein M440DRAFT_1440621 [Trichoderma longibrachiatum ATCC 18648]|uniref:Sedlin n=1 Tax=Trichoderma longibrachiatum ATCC 18648 TaxID=983965 RepID=A0A2T4BYT2_TRILO|nr:hypothetical protein M440DRAFT_1440621 [Trichoderma longibrachiatum ATCC 18648]
MSAAIPSVACLGVIGRNNNPLHISIFPAAAALGTGGGAAMSASSSSPSGAGGGPSTLASSSAAAATARSAVGSVGAGLRDAELKPVFRAMQSAYVRLLQNPFYDPDEHAPLGGKGGKRITSKKFGDAMKRIGEAWTPGVTVL